METLMRLGCVEGAYCAFEVLIRRSSNRWLLLTVFVILYSSCWHPL